MSVAFHVTIVSPTGYVAVALLVITGEGSSSSDAVALPISTGVCGPVASVVILAGAEIDGGVSALTIIVINSSSEFPDESVTFAEIR